MAQSITWGFPFAVQGSLYAGVAPYLAESNPNSGTPPGGPGTGFRMGARHFKNDPSQLFVNSGSADVHAFNQGVRMVVSVSNPTALGGSANYSRGLPGGSAQVSNDANWNALFGRIKPSGGNLLHYSTAVDTSGGNVPGSYGGFTWPDITIIIDHEVDRPDKHVVAADFIAYWRHIYGLATTAGVQQYITWNFCVTVNDGIRLGRVDPFYPGGAYVDELGLDYYGDFTNTWTFDGTVTPFATGFAQSLAWIRGKGKPFNCPEFCQAESGNDTAMQAWYTGVATTLNAATDVTCTGIYSWSQPSGVAQNACKLASQDPATGTAHAGKHAGIIAAITATGGSANPGATPTTAPSAPTNMHVVSFSSDGTQATIGWDAAPTWTPAVANMRFYQATGVSTGPPNVGGDLAVANTRVITGLIAGGQQYTVAATWKNSVGNSGYGTTAGGSLLTFSTPTPGVGVGDPTITGVTINANGIDPLKYDLAVTATDPNSLTLTDTWSLLSPSGNTSSYTGASVTTAELTEPGTWAYAVTARNTNGKFTTQSGTWGVSAPGDTTHTKYSRYPKPLTNITRARDLGPLLRPFMEDIDKRVTQNSYHKSSWNAARGLLGSSFPPSAIHTSTVQALTSGWAYWTAITLEDDHFGSIWFDLSVVQSGTGTQLAVYDSNLSILPNGVYTNTMVGADGRTVDQAFQNTWQSGAVGGARYVLPNPEVSRTPGETLYLQVYNSAAATPPSLVVSGARSTAAKLGSIGMVNPAYGGYNLGVGQTLPNALAVGSYIPQLQLWFGFGEITD